DRGARRSVPVGVSTICGHGARNSALGMALRVCVDSARSQTSHTTTMILILQHADVLVTMDARRREIADGALGANGPAIEWVGATADLPETYRRMIGEGRAEAIDMRGHVVMPGLVNTHHHMYQSLTRAVPAAQDAELFGWLTNLYMIWSHLTPEMIGVSTQT